MRLGTKSVLFGAHAFYLHPFFVAAAWAQLFGFPWDPRLWFAFFLHDLGYIGKPNMDGDEGEQHPYWGAFVMGALFGRRWYEFTLAHSRYLAKRIGVKPSPLCIADKLAIALTPAWLYLPMVRATGELEEYLDRAHRRAASNEKLTDEERREATSNNAERWYAGVQTYMRRWVEEHKDGRADTWTGSQRPAGDGVWT
jgi:hypothetical protein